MPAIHRIMELTFGDGSKVEDAAALEERRSWVEWQILNRRILAFTDYTNLASQAVMRKAGMTITRNPHPEPPWLQIASFILNPSIID